jgi:hypothetical protein
VKCGEGEEYISGLSERFLREIWCERNLEVHVEGSSGTASVNGLVADDG